MGAFQCRSASLTAWLICVAVLHSYSDAQSTRNDAKLKVCIVTADFWGMLKSDTGRGVRAMLKGGGGTATATHLLANTLREQDFTRVTFLGVTKEVEVCTQAQKVGHVI